MSKYLRKLPFIPGTIIILRKAYYSQNYSGILGAGLLHGPNVGVAQGEGRGGTHPDNVSGGSVLLLAAGHHLRQRLDEVIDPVAPAPLHWGGGGVAVSNAAPQSARPVPGRPLTFIVRRLPLLLPVLATPLQHGRPAGQSSGL